MFTAGNLVSMICPACAHAADNKLPRDKHCDSDNSPGSPCDCAHRTDKYGQVTMKIPQVA